MWARLENHVRFPSPLPGLNSDCGRSNSGASLRCAPGFYSIVPPALTVFTPRQLNHAINSLNPTLSRLFSHFEKDIQPLLAGKLAVKFTVCLFGFGEVAEFDGFLFHRRES